MEEDIDFCELNDLIIGNTYFEHNDIHKFTRQGWRETKNP